MNLRLIIAKKVNAGTIPAQAYLVVPVQTMFSADDPNCQSLLDSR